MKKSKKKINKLKKKLGCSQISHSHGGALGDVSQSRPIPEMQSSNTDMVKLQVELDESLKMVQGLQAESAASQQLMQGLQAELAASQRIVQELQAELAASQQMVQGLQSELAEFQQIEEVTDGYIETILEQKMIINKLQEEWSKDHKPITRSSKRKKLV